MTSRLCKTASLLAVLLGACGGEGVPQADVRATVVAAVSATVEALPSPTSVPPTPTSTPIPPARVLSASASVRSGNALIADVDVSLDKAASVYVEYGNADTGRFRTMGTGAVAARHVVPVVRLRPSTTYEYQAFAVDSDGRESDGVGGTFTTGELPDTLATIDFSAQGEPTPDLVLMDYRDAASSYLLALDRTSKVVWYYNSPNPFPPEVSGIQAVRQKANFNFVFYAGSPRAPCCLREVTPLGEVVDQLAASELDDTPHHDFLVLPKNKVMYLAEETRIIDDTANGGDAETRVTGDVIRVWDQNAGTTTELWNSFDHLSTDDRVVWERDPKRWTHFNSIQIAPRGDIIVSSRNRNQVISIAADFQSVRWFLGGPNSSFVLPGPLDRFYRQHTATELPNGNILLFDNGADRPEEEGGEYSRALELAIRDYDGSAVKVWEYRHAPDIYASFISSAYRLDNGNTLVNFGTTTDVESVPITLVEVDRDGNEVWKLRMAGPTLKNRYRAYPLLSILGETRLP